MKSMFFFFDPHLFFLDPQIFFDPYLFFFSSSTPIYVHRTFSLVGHHVSSSFFYHVFMLLFRHNVSSPLPIINSQCLLVYRFTCKHFHNSHCSSYFLMSDDLSSRAEVQKPCLFCSRSDFCCLLSLPKPPSFARESSAPNPPRPPRPVPPPRPPPPRPAPAPPYPWPPQPHLPRPPPLSLPHCCLTNHMLSSSSSIGTSF